MRAGWRHLPVLPGFAGTGCACETELGSELVERLSLVNVRLMVIALVLCGRRIVGINPAED